MKKKMNYLIITSGIFLIIGMIGFAISPLLFDSNISKTRDTISDYKYHKELFSKNWYDSMTWWRNAGLIRNHVEVLIQLNADKSLIQKRHNDFITETKFSLNSTVISQYVARGELKPDLEAINKRWDGITEGQDFFEINSKEVEKATAESDKLEKKIIYNKNKIDRLETQRKWFWIACIFFQSIGLFLGTFYSFLKE